MARQTPLIQKSLLPWLCALGALVGCSVVLEGNGPQQDASFLEGGNPSWVAVPGALQGGGTASGGATGGPGGSGGPGSTSGGTAGGEAGGGTWDGGPPAVDAGDQTDGGVPVGEDGQVSATECQLDGMFALDFTLDVLWQGTDFGLVPVIDAGEGHLSFVLLAKLTSSPRGAEVLAQVCGTTVPDFVSSLFGEQYAPRFKDEMWDSPSMPSFSFQLQADCREPGCTLQSAQIHAQLGAELPNRAGQWPADTSTGVWPDHDGDGRPGITAHMLGSESFDANDEPYAHPPVHPLFIRRVTQIMLGLRIQVLLDATLTDCDSLRGGTLEANVDTRALTCTAEQAPLECSADELAFLDDNLPLWAVRDGSLRGARLADSADCAAARAAFR